MTRRRLMLTSVAAVAVANGRAGLPGVIVDDGNPHGDPPFLLESGWTPLLNDKDLSGWRYEHPEKGIWTTSPAIYWDGQHAPKELKALPGPGSRIANGPTGRNSNIYTKGKFGDVELYVEFLIPARSNSGVYLHGLYEVQIYDSYDVQHPTYIDCGAIYERWINEKGVGGWPPFVNASRPSGEWQSFHIWFRDHDLTTARKSRMQRLPSSYTMEFSCIKTLRLTAQPDQD